MKRAIVFDLDDTLYAERDFAKSGYRAAERFLVGLNGTTGLAKACEDLFDAGERARIFDLALPRLGLEPEAGLVARLVDIYRHHSPGITLPSDTVRFLAAMPDDWGFGIITDGDAATQQAKLEALDLDKRAHRIIRTGEWGGDFRKPHPRSYAEMETHFELPAERLAYVADNPAKDFVTPRQRGWLTVQINRPHRVHPPEAPGADFAARETIRSLDELADILQRHPVGGGKKALHAAGSR